MHENAPDRRDSVARAQGQRTVRAQLVGFVLGSSREPSVVEAVDAAAGAGSGRTVAAPVRKRRINGPRASGGGGQRAQFRPVVVRWVLQEGQKADRRHLAEAPRGVWAARLSDVDDGRPAHPTGT